MRWPVDGWHIAFGPPVVVEPLPLPDPVPVPLDPVPDEPPPAGFPMSPVQPPNTVEAPNNAMENNACRVFTSEALQVARPERTYP
jgi:hypothetical protein